MSAWLFGFLSILLFCQSGECRAVNGCPDLDFDGEIGVVDLASLLSNWGASEGLCAFTECRCNFTEFFLWLEQKYKEEPRLELQEVTLEADESGRGELFIKSLGGVRLLMEATDTKRSSPGRSEPFLYPRLLFGDQDAAQMIEGSPHGITLHDRYGLKLVNPETFTSSNLIFGPSNDLCHLGPAGGPGSNEGGILLTDPRGLFLQPPKESNARPYLNLGRGSRIGSDSSFGEGLSLQDPFGVRIVPTKTTEPRQRGVADSFFDVFFDVTENREANSRLLFGPTDDCVIEAGPDGPSGLILRDPNGVRILSPASARVAKHQIIFGPTDDCSLGIEPGSSGLLLRDPAGLLLKNGGAGVSFGSPECSIGGSFGKGLIFTDPNGFTFNGGVIKSNNVIQAVRFLTLGRKRGETVDMMEEIEELRTEVSQLKSELAELKTLLLQTIKHR